MTVTLYTREECHLCHEAEDELRRIRAVHPFDLVVVDLDREAAPAKRALYDHEVPVVELDGRKIMKYRVDAARLARLLRDRPEPEPADEPDPTPRQP